MKSSQEPTFKKELEKALRDKKRYHDNQLDLTKLNLSSDDINTDVLITFLNTTNNLVKLDLSNDSIHGGNQINKIGENLLNCIASHPTLNTIHFGNKVQADQYNFLKRHHGLILQDKSIDIATLITKIKFDPEFKGLLNNYAENDPEAIISLTNKYPEIIYLGEAVTILKNVTIEQKHQDTLKLCECVYEKMRTTTEGQILKSIQSIRDLNSHISTYVYSVKDKKLISERDSTLKDINELLVKINSSASQQNPLLVQTLYESIFLLIRNINRYHEGDKAYINNVGNTYNLNVINILSKIDDRFALNDQLAHRNQLLRRETYHFRFDFSSFNTYSKIPSNDAERYLATLKSHANSLEQIAADPNNCELFLDRKSRIHSFIETQREIISKQFDWLLKHESVDPDGHKKIIDFVRSDDIPLYLKRKGDPQSIIDYILARVNISSLYLKNYLPDILTTLNIETSAQKELIERTRFRSVIHQYLQEKHEEVNYRKAREIDALLKNSDCSRKDIEIALLNLLNTNHKKLQGLLIREYSIIYEEEFDKSLTSDLKYLEGISNNNKENLKKKFLLRNKNGIDTYKLDKKTVYISRGKEEQIFNNWQSLALSALEYMTDDDLTLSTYGLESLKQAITQSKNIGDLYAALPNFSLASVTKFLGNTLNINHDTNIKIYFDNIKEALLSGRKFNAHDNELFNSLFAERIDRENLIRSINKQYKTLLNLHKSWAGTLYDPFNTAMMDETTKGPLAYFKKELAEFKSAIDKLKGMDITALKDLNNRMSNCLNDDNCAFLKEQVDIIKQEVALEKPQAVSEKPEVALEKPEAVSEKTEVALEKPEAVSEKTEVALEKPEAVSEKTEVALEREEPGRNVTQNAQDADHKHTIEQATKLRDAVTKLHERYPHLATHDRLPNLRFIRHAELLANIALNEDKRLDTLAYSYNGLKTLNDNLENRFQIIQKAAEKLEARFNKINYLSKCAEKIMDESHSHQDPQESMTARIILHQLISLSYNSELESHDLEVVENQLRNLNPRIFELNPEHKIPVNVKHADIGRIAAQSLEKSIQPVKYKGRHKEKYCRYEDSEKGGYASELKSIKDVYTAIPQGTLTEVSAKAKIGTDEVLRLVNAAKHKLALFEEQSKQWASIIDILKTRTDALLKLNPDDIQLAEIEKIREELAKNQMPQPTGNLLSNISAKVDNLQRDLIIKILENQTPPVSHVEPHDTKNEVSHKRTSALTEHSIFVNTTQSEPKSASEDKVTLTKTGNLKPG